MKKVLKKSLVCFMVIALLLSSLVISASAVSGSEIVSYARQFVGCAYVSGGKGPSSFDCSGFVYYVFKHFGISLPSASSPYWSNPTNYGTVIATGSTSQAKAGDIIVWSGHVAIYTENGYCVEALNTKYGVTDSFKVDAHTNGKNYKVLRIYGVGDGYTLSYDANGGSGAPSSQTGSTSYTISSTVPTRFGYNFIGWGDSPNSTSTYSKECNLSLSGNKTLYAIWREAGDITDVIYTGGSIGYNEKDYYKFSPSVTAIYTFLTLNPTNGLDPQGTIYSSSGTSLAYDDDSGEGRNFSVSYNMTQGYTYYLEIKGYSGSTGNYDLHIYDSLYYDANGGSGAPSVQTGKEIYTISSTVPSRTNYTFLGWSTNPNATSAEYNSGSTIYVWEPTTLYAVWRYNPPSSYTLTYNANGGSGAPSSQSGSTSYAISSTVPHRVGYTFLGWSTSSSDSSFTYIPGNTITLSSNTTLYASWQAARTVNTSSSNLANINFENQVRAYKFVPSSSGTYIFESNGSTDSKIYLYNSSGTELANNDDGGNGNNFRLSYNLNSGSTYYLGVRIFSSGTGEVTFTVTKESSTPTTYTLTYNANGGSGAPSSQTGATRYTVSSTKPTRSGYTFLGWSKSSSATSASYVAGNTITLSANTTLYAVWSRNSSSNNDNIKVTIRNNPGTMTLNYGDTVKIYADAQNLPSGAKIGWYVDDGSTISAKVSDDGTYCDITATGNGTVTLAAKAVDANGNVMTDSNGYQIADVQKINTKSNIWLKIVSFFKNLFGINRTTVQLFKELF